MSLGYYAKRDSSIEYWVHDNQSHDHVMALRYLPDLLRTLQLEAAFSNSDLLDYGDQKHFFNVAYRGDFEHQTGYCTCYNASNHIWLCQTNTTLAKIEKQRVYLEPQKINGCELVLPLTVPAKQISGKWLADQKVTLGIAPSIAYEKMNIFKLDLDWSHQNFCGKNMNSSAILKCQSPWRYSQKLFSGLLHGLGGRTLSKSALDSWLTAMIAKHQQPQQTMILFAPVMSIGQEGKPVYQWYGIYHRLTEEQTNSVMRWTPIKELVNQDSFWQTMLDTASSFDVTTTN